MDEPTSYVCARCLLDHSHDITLIENFCFTKAAHGDFQQQQSGKVLVVWNGEKSYLEAVSVPFIRPLPSLPYMKGGFKMCDGILCKGKHCTYAHSIEEKISWNAQKFHQPSQRRKNIQTCIRPVARISSPLNPPLATGLCINALYKPLRRDTYKDKFTELLKCEREARRGILREKCDGDFTLEMGVTPPASMWQDSCNQGQCFGYLTGLDGDQIEYASQASQGLTIQFRDGGKVRAKIHSLQNYQHVEEKLLIAYEPVRYSNHELKELPSGKVEVHVIFELKESYFENLRNSVERLLPEVIAKIIPDRHSFIQPQETSSAARIEHYRKECSNDAHQFSALKAIVSHPSRGPPVAILGVFGTGKTRVLALAAKYFIDESSEVQMLVCTQQRRSASIFLESFLDLHPSTEDLDIYYIQNYGAAPNKAMEPWFCSSEIFTKKYMYSRCDDSRERRNLLVVTTCITAGHLKLPKGSFSHIFLDEGANMREPENVAPLSLASVDTKLVIVGDPNQVGPATLVQGEKALRNGLAVSLLERLYSAYTSNELRDVADTYKVVLESNYRCHSKILQVCRSLHYEIPVRRAEWSAEPPLHPEAQYPLQFICSNVNNDDAVYLSHTSRHEARVVLREVESKATAWPTSLWGRKDLSQFCVICNSRSQISVMKELIRREKMAGFEALTFFPTFDIQGREFRAVFLCTSEPTEGDGATRIPTKSFCNPYVFNTVITRAQSLVVSVGNPFLLLRMEDHMVVKYGENGRCWSNYLHSCLENNTLNIHGQSLNEAEDTSSCIEDAVKQRIKQSRAHLPQQYLLQSHQQQTLDVYQDSHAQGQPVCDLQYLQHSPGNIPYCPPATHEAQRQLLEPSPSQHNVELQPAAVNVHVLSSNDPLKSTHVGQHNKVDFEPISSSVQVENTVNKKFNLHVHPDKNKEHEH